MRIGKVMHRDVQIIGPKESLRTAAAMMKKLDAGVLPVGEHDKLIPQPGGQHNQSDAA